MEIDDLILQGALEPAGLDPETGEVLYNFTNKLKDVNPVLHREVNNMFNSHIMKFWELGLINMDIMSDDPVVTLNEKAFDEFLISALDEDELFTLKEIKRNLLRE